MTEELVNIPKNIARASPYIIYLSGLSSSVVTGKSIGAVFSLSAIIFGDGLNYVLKKIFKSIGPNNKSWMRPSIPPDGTGIFPSYSPSKTITWGMPSGHSQIVSYSAAFWILYLWKNSHAPTWWSVMGTGIISIISALIMYSRIATGCHNLQQVIVGSIFGSTFGIGSYYFLANKYPSLFN
ncbi:dolichyldiphosphatase [Tupanvirus soda lake]|uniref:Dolichyldiphosphatase n=2 Tax=Tupanvirus TaxID=2094720 RepID=A0A6N1NWG6_9VIRU|nr:dolichyldiphosphatase [Tupanvirus soda lake]QKU35648.1 dolichyldiphosphatase [Tupanvirus soda lake]